MEKLLPWFALKSVPGIGNHLYKRLIERFDAPQSVFDAPFEALARIDGMSAVLAHRIRTHRTPDSVRKELDLAAAKGCRIVTQADREFPPLLREIPDPPPYLYVRGKMDAGRGHIAIVGSRNASRYGLVTARRLGADLADRGLTVVSGMALGIDTAAHIGALDADMPTVAVLGSGLGRIYPAANRDLSRRIAEKGAVVSEFPVMAEPAAHHFPARNRIISGLSLGTVVVEATRRSGSLITARLSAEQNREVFAVPGSIQSFKSTGTHTLIKQGAKLVEHAEDIIEELAPMMAAACPSRAAPKRQPASAMAGLSPEERQVVNALGAYPVHIDELVRALNMAPGKLSGLLLQLELRGWVCQEPGKMFVLKEPA